jgi:hypothetical protein
MLLLTKIKSPPLVKYPTRNHIYDLEDLNEYSIRAPRLRLHNGYIRQQNSRDVISIVVRTPNGTSTRLCVDAILQVPAAL